MAPIPKILCFVACMSFTMVVAAADPLASPSNSPTPPVAKKVHTENHVNGGDLVDDYRWLREKSNPEVVQYLEAENAYTDAFLKPTEGLQKKLYDEMVSHIKETDVNVPWQLGGYFYYSRWEAGKQYPIAARKKGSLTAPEQVILDVNELAKGEQFMALGESEVSDDANLLAYTTDNTGFRQYRLHVRDMRTGKDLTDTAEKVGSIAWANDNQTLFYTVEDPAKRQYQLYRHKLGAESKNDDLIYEEKDERFEVSVRKTRSGKYLMLESGSHTTSEVRYLEADRPSSEWSLIAPRRQDVEYYADHLGDRFYIRTNDLGRNFRLVSAPIKSPGSDHWKEVIPLRKNVMLEGFEPFQDFYALVEREDGLPQITIVKLASGARQRITYPEPVYSAFPQINREFKTALFRYSYQSLVTPNSVFDTTWKNILPRSSNRMRFPGDTILQSTSPKECGPWLGMAQKSLSLLFTGRTSRRRMARIRCMSTDTAPTEYRYRSASAAAALACWTAGWSWPMSTSAAAVKWARRGTTPDA